MALIKETRIEPAVPAKEVEKVVGVSCELCGRRGRGEDWPVGGDYGNGSFDKAEVHVGLRTGEIYPEGGTWYETILDICPDCFKAKLLVWFRAQGCVERQKEIDL